VTNFLGEMVDFEIHERRAFARDAAKASGGSVEAALRAGIKE